MNLTLGRLIKSGFLLSGFDTSFSTDQNLSSSDFHQPVFFYWGSWRKEFRNQKNFQPVRFSRPIFEKFKTLAIVTPQIAKLTQILQKIHILEFKLSKRNFQITKIVTLTQIVIPFLTSRKCDSYEWLQLLIILNFINMKWMVDHQIAYNFSLI